MASNTVTKLYNALQTDTEADSPEYVSDVIYAFLSTLADTGNIEEDTIYQIFEQLGVDNLQVVNAMLRYMEDEYWYYDVNILPPLFLRATRERSRTAHARAVHCIIYNASNWSSTDDLLTLLNAGEVSVHTIADAIILYDMDNLVGDVVMCALKNLGDAGMRAFWNHLSEDEVFMKRLHSDAALVAKLRDSELHLVDTFLKTQ